MKLIVARIVAVVAWGLSGSVIALAFYVYLIDRYDPATRRWNDGFGRELHRDMWSAFGTELTPGILWEITDTAVAIVLFGICAGLFALARRLRNPQ